VGVQVVVPAEPVHAVLSNEQKQLPAAAHGTSNVALVPVPWIRVGSVVISTAFYAPALLPHVMATYGLPQPKLPDAMLLKVGVTVRLIVAYAVRVTVYHVILGVAIVV